MLAVAVVRAVADAPVVEADRQIEQKAVVAGEIEVKKAGEFTVFKHHVVAEQVGVHRAAGQGGIRRQRRHVVLVGQFGADQGILARAQVRQHHRHGFIPPRQAAQVGLAHAEIAPGQVQAREHVAHRPAMRFRGRQFTVAAQLVDHGGRFALQRVQDLALRIGGGFGHRDAFARQVLHEVQVVRQLLETQALEHREHVGLVQALALGGDEIVGVFDAAVNATQLGEFAQIQRTQQGCRLVKRDFGVNGHEKYRRSEVEDAPAAFASGALVLGVGEVCAGRQGRDFVAGCTVLGLHGDAARLATHAQLVDARKPVFVGDALDARAARGRAGFGRHDRRRFGGWRRGLGQRGQGKGQGESRH
ncbi:hypothetical protein FQZ97_791150 [compost metagenome]